MSQSNAPRILTPRFTAIWPKLNEPDFKFKPLVGEFHSKGAVESGDIDLDDFIAKIEAIRDERYDEEVARLVNEKKSARAKELKKVSPFKVETEEETGEETGRIIFKVAMNHKVTSKKTGKTYLLRPDFFNAQKVKLNKPPVIGGGSILRAFVEPSPYFMEKDKEIGVKLRLAAIQIIKLRQYGGRSADDYGFEAEDGDDVQDQLDTAPVDDVSDEADDGNDDL